MTAPLRLVYPTGTSALVSEAQIVVAEALLRFQQVRRFARRVEGQGSVRVRG